MHTVEIREDGSVWASGDNEFGQTGLGLDLDKIETPTQIHSLSNIQNVITGSDHTFFVSNTGELYACGNNKNGQLGLGRDSTHFLSPKLVPLPDNEQVEKLLVGSGSTIIETQSGKLVVFGKSFDPTPSYLDSFTNQRILGTSTLPKSQPFTGLDSTGNLSEYHIKELRNDRIPGLNRSGVFILESTPVERPFLPSKASMTTQTQPEISKKPKAKL